MWILGGYQSDFARNLDREGLDFADLTAEVVDATLAAARVDAADIDVVHVANAFGELFARQGHLGAMPATVHDGLWDVPATRHEAACASGSVATLAAIADLRSGAYRTALVVGVELEKTVPGDTATDDPRRRGVDRPRRRGREIHVAAHVRRASPPSTTAATASTTRICGPSRHCNFANARANPNAQTRAWTVPEPLTDDDVSNPIVEGRLRRFDCSQITDGGAGVVLVTDDWLRDHPDARPLGRIDGWGHRTVGLGLQQKLDRSAGTTPYVLPHVRYAVLDAFDRAQVTLDDVDGFEVHDCFTPSEYLAIDHIGLTGAGRVVEGHRERRDRRRRPAARSTPAAG